LVRRPTGGGRGYPPWWGPNNRAPAAFHRAAGQPIEAAPWPVQRSATGHPPPDQQSLPAGRAQIHRPCASKKPNIPPSSGSTIFSRVDGGRLVGPQSKKASRKGHHPSAMKKLPARGSEPGTCPALEPSLSRRVGRLVRQSLGPAFPNGPIWVQFGQILRCFSGRQRAGLRTPNPAGGSLGPDKPRPSTGKARRPFGPWTAVRLVACPPNDLDRQGNWKITAAGGLP